MTFYVKLVDKEEGIKISNIINKPDESGSICGDPLCFLPPDLFGKVHEVISISSCYEIFNKEDQYAWYVPSYFIENLIPEDRISVKDIPTKLEATT